eukprot:1159991-Pelagomonas_calceolata.AAC.2
MAYNGDNWMRLIMLTNRGLHEPVKKASAAAGQALCTRTGRRCVGTPEVGIRTSEARSLPTPAV